MNLQIKQLSESATLPTRAFDTDAGMISTQRNPLYSARK